MDISIIVPLYQGNKYINKILKMVENNKKNLLQNYSIEVIFINDFPDEVITLPNSLTEVDTVIKIYQNTINIGIHASRIHGLKKSTGKWIIFLDQDDTITDTYFSSQLKKINGHDAVVSNGYWRNGEKIYSDTYPLKYPLTFDVFLKEGYPLISLGQLLIKKNAIPDAWTQKPLKHNGCDDLYLWTLIMVNSLKVAINNDPIYIHEEHEDNASFNFMEMRLSIENVKKEFLSLNCIDEKKSVYFSELMDRIASKYHQYEKLNAIFDHADSHQIEERLLHRKIKTVAIYGVGIYGKKLLKLLKNTSIEICYGIDIRADVKNVGIPTINVNMDFQPVDAIIVTPIFAFQDIYKVLKRKQTFPCQIICLNEIL